MRQTLSFANVSAESGKKTLGTLKVPGVDYEMPIAIINGDEDGKILCVSATIHGCEYPGPESLSELAVELEPKGLKGAVVLLPIINPSSFYGRQPYVCAADEDRTNYNHIFPGDMGDTLAYKVARYLEDALIPACDFHVDMHSGDIVEDLDEFVAICNSPKKEILDEAEDVAKHLLFKARIFSHGRHEFYNSSAIDRGVPSMLFERGCAGKWTKEQVDRNKEDVRRIMMCLGIMDGDVPLNETQIFYPKHEWSEAGHTGFFHKYVNIGDDIKKGELIGEIKDTWGNTIEEIRAKFDGHVKIANNTLGIAEGDDTFMYGSEIE